MGFLISRRRKKGGRAERGKLCSAPPFFRASPSIHKPSIHRFLFFPLRLSTEKKGAKSLTLHFFYFLFYTIGSNLFQIWFTYLSQSSRVNLNFMCEKSCWVFLLLSPPSPSGPITLPGNWTPIHAPPKPPPPPPTHEGGAPFFLPHRPIHLIVTVKWVFGRGGGRIWEDNVSGERKKGGGGGALLRGTVPE